MMDKPIYGLFTFPAIEAMKVIAPLTLKSVTFLSIQPKLYVPDMGLSTTMFENKFVVPRFKHFRTILKPLRSLY